MYSYGHRQTGEGDISEDGHPMQAAMEFRRWLIIHGISDEIPADILDLCYHFSWLGKAVRQVLHARGIHEVGLDFNSFHAIRFFASSLCLSRLGYDVLKDYEDRNHLDQGCRQQACVLCSLAYRNAMRAVAKLLDSKDNDCDLGRFHKLNQMVLKVEMEENVIASVALLLNEHDNRNIVFFQRSKKTEIYRGSA